MKIVADANIPYVSECFSSIGEVTVVGGRQMTPWLVADADVLLVRSITPVGVDLLAGSGPQLSALVLDPSGGDFQIGVDPDAGVHVGQKFTLGQSQVDLQIEADVNELASSKAQGDRENNTKQQRLHSCQRRMRRFG